MPGDAALTSFGIVIPARMGATRLPGKPLREIAGKPLIGWVLENAQQAGAEFVWVATDDVNIATAVMQLGGDAVLTSAEHPSGTDRLAEVVRLRELPPETLIVNVQGDEPLLEPGTIELVASALAARPKAAMTTLATRIHRVKELFSPNVVKVVLDRDGYARTFTRAPVPWMRDAFAAGPPAELPASVPFLRHVGLYAYRAQTLLSLAEQQPVPWERAESLEQLRALWLGLPIHVTVVQQAPPHGVDTEEDLRKVEELLQARET